MHLSFESCHDVIYSADVTTVSKRCFILPVAAAASVFTPSFFFFHLSFLCSFSSFFFSSFLCSFSSFFFSFSSFFISFSFSLLSSSSLSYNMSDTECIHKLEDNTVRDNRSFVAHTLSSILIQFNPAIVHIFWVSSDCTSEQHLV